MRPGGFGDGVRRPRGRADDADGRADCSETHRRAATITAATNGDGTARRKACGVRPERLQCVANLMHAGSGLVVNH
jgi:hypothetical protein